MDTRFNQCLPNNKNQVRSASAIVNYQLFIVNYYIDLEEYYVYQSNKGSES